MWHDWESIDAVREDTGGLREARVHSGGMAAV